MEGAGFSNIRPEIFRKRIGPMDYGPCEWIITADIGGETRTERLIDGPTALADLCSAFVGAH